MNLGAIFIFLDWSLTDDRILVVLDAMLPASLMSTRVTIS